MKRAEFEPFVEHLMGAMPSYASWLEKMPAASAEASIPSQRSVLDAFYRVVERVPLADACRAIDLIHAGDEPEPRVYDHLPRSVRQISFKLRRNRASSSGGHEQRRLEPCRCAWCQDSGIVYVLAAACQWVLGQCWGRKVPHDWPRWYDENPEAEEARQVINHRHRSTEAAMSCFCEAGRRGDLQFDPVKDCLYHPQFPEEVVRWFAEGPRVPRIEPDGRRVPIEQWALWQPEAA